MKLVVVLQSRQSREVFLQCLDPKAKIIYKHTVHCHINMTLLFNSLLFQKLAQEDEVVCFRHLKEICLYEQQTFQLILRANALLRREGSTRLFTLHFETHPLNVSANSQLDHEPCQIRIRTFPTPANSLLCTERSTNDQIFQYPVLCLSP